MKSSEFITSSSQSGLLGWIEHLQTQGKVFELFWGDIFRMLFVVLGISVFCIVWRTLHQRFNTAFPQHKSWYQSWQRGWIWIIGFIFSLWIIAEISELYWAFSIVLGGIILLSAAGAFRELLVNLLAYPVVAYLTPQ